MKRFSAKRKWCKNWYARPYFEKALRRCNGIFPESANGCRVRPLNYYMRWQLVRFEREFLFFFRATLSIRFYRGFRFGLVIPCSVFGMLLAVCVRLSVVETDGYAFWGPGAPDVYQLGSHTGLRRRAPKSTLFLLCFTVDFVLDDFSHCVRREALCATQL